MPSFKPKANKKILVSKKSNVTVDSKHQEKMIEFKKNEKTIIPKLKEERKKYKTKLKTKNLSIDETLELKDKIRQHTKQINHYEKERKNYLLDNSKYVFDYYEKKKDLADGDDSKTKVLFSFFSKTNDTKSKKQEVNNTQKYLNNIDESYLDINDYIHAHEVCAKCSGELIPVESEGVMICKVCSYQINFIIEHEKPSYKEPPKEVCFYAYKRINHFREILAQFQAKETTQIPDEVLKNITLQIKKERITLAQMSNKKAKDILKKLGYNKYYEHIPFINEKFGIKPPIMTQELEETLCNLFFEIQAPYSKYCPNYRINFLNYYYTLFKLCELLGEYSYLEHIPKLKDDQKRMEQDEIWKKICIEKDWEFIPTL